MEIVYGTTIHTRSITKILDTLWTKKGVDIFYDYKNHAKVCRKTKLITGYDITSASVHDSKRGTELVDDNDAVTKSFGLILVMLVRRETL